MHQQFNIQQLYVLPTLYLCVLYLSENKQRFCHLQHKLIGFYNRDEKCLLRAGQLVVQLLYGTAASSKRCNPLNAELNPIRRLLARHIVHVSRIRVKHILKNVVVT